MALILLIAAIVFIDLGIKNTIEKAKETVFPKELEGSKGMLVLLRSHNEGFPFGILCDKKELVKQVPFAVLSAAFGIFVWLFPKRGHRIEKISLALILGGGISNLYDRKLRGYVVDYLNIQWGKLKKIVFNLADVCILMGALLMLLSELTEMKSRQ